MPFKVFENLFFLLSIVFKVFVIHGGSRDVIFIVSWGMKFDMIFRKILVKVLVCQVVITLKPFTNVDQMQTCNEHIIHT